MAERLQISLDVELTDPIQGRVSDGAGHEHEFSGWLEMSSSIEDLCDAARPAALKATRTTGDTDDGPG